MQSLEFHRSYQFLNNAEYLILYLFKFMVNNGDLKYGYVLKVYPAVVCIKGNIVPLPETCRAQYEFVRCLSLLPKNICYTWFPLADCHKRCMGRYPALL